MAFLNNIEQIRQVEWGKKYLWDVKFDDPLRSLPAPFDEWFPAQDVEDNVANLESYQFEGPISSFKVPRKSSVKDVKLTFIDDAAFTLFTFFEEWVNLVIFNDDLFVSTLSESVKTLQIIKLNAQRQIVSGKTRTLLVYPEGPIIFNGSSTSDPQNYSIPLVIAGVVRS